MLLLLLLQSEHFMELFLNLFSERFDRVREIVFLYLCSMKNKVRIQPMTGIQMMIEAKKMKEKMEEREEAITEAMALKMALMNGYSPKKGK